MFRLRRRSPVGITVTRFLDEGAAGSTFEPVVDKEATGTFGNQRPMPRPVARVRCGQSEFECGARACDIVEGPSPFGLDQAGEVQKVLRRIRCASDDPFETCVELAKLFGEGQFRRHARAHAGGKAIGAQNVRYCGDVKAGG